MQRPTLLRALFCPNEVLPYSSFLTSGSLSDENFLLMFQRAWPSNPLNSHSINNSAEHGGLSPSSRYQNRISLDLLTSSNHMAFGGRILVMVPLPGLFPYGHLLRSAGEVS